MSIALLHTECPIGKDRFTVILNVLQSSFQYDQSDFLNILHCINFSDIELLIQSKFPNLCLLKNK